MEVTNGNDEKIEHPYPVGPRGDAKKQLLEWVTSEGLFKTEETARILEEQKQQREHAVDELVKSLKAAEKII